MSSLQLFVYGTLRRGFHNHHLLDGAEFKGTTSVRGYMMTQNGIPFVHKTNENSFVEGEVYEVSPETMRRIDQLEGYDPLTDTGWYMRRQTNTVKNQQVWVYEGPENTRDYPRSAHIHDDGGLTMYFYTRDRR